MHSGGCLALILPVAWRLQAAAAGCPEGGVPGWEGVASGVACMPHLQGGSALAQLCPSVRLGSGIPEYSRFARLCLSLGLYQVVLSGFQVQFHYCCPLKLPAYRLFPGHFGVDHFLVTPSFYQYPVACAVFQYLVVQEPRR